MLDEIDELVRQRDEAYVAKVRYLGAHEQLFVYVARTFEAQCRLAGEAELAERVRRSTSRRQTEKVAEVSGEEEEESVVPSDEVDTAAP